MISACKPASAKRVTPVLPLFPYSRQSDIPYNKAGAPLVKSSLPSKLDSALAYTFESTPPTPRAEKSESAGLAGGVDGLQKGLTQVQIEQDDNIGSISPQKTRFSLYANGVTKRSDTMDSAKSDTSSRQRHSPMTTFANGALQDDTASFMSTSSKMA